MQVSITARHFDLTEGLREHTEEKLARLGKYGVDLHEAHVVLVVEKHRHKAEVSLHGTGFHLTGASESGDMYTSVDQVAQKLEAQMRKQKGRLQSRKLKGRGDEFAKVQVLGSGGPAEEGGLRVLHSGEESAPSMSVEDAIAILDKTNQDYLLFTNPATERLTVLLKRKDGNYGTVEI
ncbi:MAG: ribosome-associated translation inhibitor RaiA [Candidatus Latescibacterota bacterium]|nr:MAG: ribosome-associated translation inhibitor RaiA [Candidatus Latescibacterota bacterium]